MNNRNLVSLAAALRMAVLGSLSALLAGCLGATVAVPTEAGEFPVPLLEPLPLAVGLMLDDTLTSYVHEEERPSNGEWRIAIGPAQPAMFNNLFAGMFTAHQQVSGVSAEEQGQEVQGILQPSIEQVQFATPAQTRTDYFEVWIRYQVKLFDDGKLLGEWPISAYGKANVQNYGISSTSPALQAAAFAACRDAMAYFAVQFQKVPAVKAWIESEAAAGPAS